MLYILTLTPETLRFFRGYERSATALAYPRYAFLITTTVPLYSGVQRRMSMKVSEAVPSIVGSLVE